MGLRRKGGVLHRSGLFIIIIIIVFVIIHIQVLYMCFPFPFPFLFPILLFLIYFLLFFFSHPPFPPPLPLFLLPTFFVFRLFSLLLGIGGGGHMIGGLVCKLCGCFFFHTTHVDGDGCGVYLLCGSMWERGVCACVRVRVCVCVYVCVHMFSGRVTFRYTVDYWARTTMLLWVGIPSLVCARACVCVPAFLLPLCMCEAGDNCLPAELLRCSLCTAYQRFPSGSPWITSPEPFLPCPVLLNSAHRLDIVFATSWLL